MGISFNKNDVFTIKNFSGETKFTLSKRMPHIIHDITGTASIPIVLNANASSRYAIVNRVDEVANLTNVNLSINKEDSFIMPFYKIDAGEAYTSNLVISGAGSILLRKLTQPSSGEYLGSSILNIVQEQGNLKIVCNQHIDRSGYDSIAGDVAINISYRVYYGRFK